PAAARDYRDPSIAENARRRHLGRGCRRRSARRLLHPPRGAGCPAVSCAPGPPGGGRTSPRGSEPRPLRRASIPRWTSADCVRSPTSIWEGCYEAPRADRTLHRLPPGVGGELQDQRPCPPRLRPRLLVERFGDAPPRVRDLAPDDISGFILRH